MVYCVTVTMYVVYIASKSKKVEHKKTKIRKKNESYMNIIKSTTKFRKNKICYFNKTFFPWDMSLKYYA